MGGRRSDTASLACQAADGASAMLRMGVGGPIKRRELTAKWRLGSWAETALGGEATANRASALLPVSYPSTSRAAHPTGDAPDSQRRPRRTLPPLDIAV